MREHGPAKSSCLSKSKVCPGLERQEGKAPCRNISQKYNSSSLESSSFPSVGLGLCSISPEGNAFLLPECHLTPSKRVSPPLKEVFAL